MKGETRVVVDLTDGKGTDPRSTQGAHVGACSAGPGDIPGQGPNIGARRAVNPELPLPLRGIIALEFQGMNCDRARLELEILPPQGQIRSALTFDM
jgi:hypothetical protein